MIPPVPRTDAQGARTTWLDGLRKTIIESYVKKRAVLSTVTITSDTELSPLNELIFCKTAGGAFGITIPDAADHKGEMFYIKKTDSSTNLVTISSKGGTIETSSTLTLSEYETTTLCSDGTDWWEI